MQKGRLRRLHCHPGLGYHQAPVVKPTREPPVIASGAKTTLLRVFTRWIGCGTVHKRGRSPSKSPILVIVTSAGGKVRGASSSPALRPCRVETVVTRLPQVFLTTFRTYNWSSMRT